MNKEKTLEPNLCEMVLKEHPNNLKFFHLMLVAPAFSSTIKGHNHILGRETLLSFLFSFFLIQDDALFQLRSNAFDHQTITQFLVW